MVKKSLLSKFLKLFADTDKQSGKNISTNEALSIQKDYISSSFYCDDEQLPNYPYVEIAKQLASQKTEIFAAALYYMCKIAQNEPLKRTRIIDLLKSISQESSVPEHNKQAILQAMENLNTK